jgi:hypothetical protein
MRKYVMRESCSGITYTNYVAAYGKAGLAFGSPSTCSGAVENHLFRVRFLRLPSAKTAHERKE